MESQLNPTVPGRHPNLETPPPAPFSLKAATVATEQAGRQLPWSPGGLRRHHEIIAHISRIFRQWRIAEFLHRFNPTEETRTLLLALLPPFCLNMPSKSHF